MKDSSQQENETTKTKKARKRASLLNDLREKLTYFEEGWYRVGELEDRMREFTDCCSTILTRLTDQGVIISEFRKNSTMLLEVSDFNRKELDHLRKSTLEFVKHIGNIEDDIKSQLERQNEDHIEWVSLTTDKIREDLQQDMDDYQSRIEIAVGRTGEDMMTDLSKSLDSRYSLINQKIDRIYQELNPMVHSLIHEKGLDLDMKKIVDGLEETVHGLESKLGLRCDLHERTVERYKERINVYLDSISRSLAELHKKGGFLENLIPAFIIAFGLIFLIWGVANCIKYFIK